MRTRSARGHRGPGGRSSLVFQFFQFFRRPSQEGCRWVVMIADRDSQGPTICVISKSEMPLCLSLSVIVITFREQLLL